MDSLDFGVQNRVNGINTSYATKPQGLQPVLNKPQTGNKKSFDRAYCQTVQAYFAPNFIKAGEKPCSVTEYTAKLQAAGLHEGKDFEVKGYDAGESFGMDILLKDTMGRIKKSTRWQNGLEKDNYTGYKKYSYNPLDSSYRKVIDYSKDNKIESIEEKTKAIPQSDFTPEGLNIDMKPEEYAAILKSKGKNVEISEQTFGDNLENYTCTVEELDENRARLNGTTWYYDNNELIGVEQLKYDDNESVDRSLYFSPDGTTSMTRYNS